MLNFHHLTDSKLLLSINKVNDRESNKIARSYLRRHRGDRKAYRRGFCKRVSFQLLRKEAIDVALHTLTYN